MQENHDRPPQITHHTTKKPTLLRRFSSACLLAMLFTALFLVLFYWHDQTVEHATIAADQNETTLRHLQLRLNDQIYEFLSNNQSVNDQNLHDGSKLDILFSSALEMKENENVIKLEVYNMSGVHIYSSNKSEVGGSHELKDSLSGAIRGEIVHYLESPDTFYGKDGVMHDIKVAVTYMPLIHAEQQVGVLGIYTDVSNLFKRIHYNIVKIILTVFLSFCALYAMLFVTMRRIDRDILQWQEVTAENEERLKLALEGSNDGVWDWNPQTDAAFFSCRWEEIIGYAEHEFPPTGKAWLEHLHPDDKDRVLSDIQRYLTGNQPTYAIEFRMRCKDGSWKWIMTRGKVVVRDASGNPQRVLGTHTDISKRKEFEKKLHNSERLFRAFIEQSPLSILLLTADGFAQSVNPAWEKMWGTTLTALKRYNIQEDKHLIANSIMPYIEKALAGEATEIPPVFYDIDSNKEMYGEAGRKLWVRSYVYPLKDEDGNIQVVALVQEDISDRKQAEIKVIDGHNLLKAIIDTAPMRIFWKDEDLRFLGCNPSFAKDAGESSPEDIIGKDDSQLGWKEQAELYQEDDRKVMTSNTPKLFYDEPQTTPDGKTIWLRTSKVPLYNSINGTTGILGVYQDITEQKQAEEALRIAATVFAAHEAIMITDVNANIIQVNKAFSEVTGYSPEEVIGKNPSIMNSGRHDRNFYIKMWQQLLHTGSWSGELFDRRKNGEVYPKWVTISAVKNEQMETTHYVAIFGDITERKRIEEEIHKLAFYDVLTKLPNRRLFLDRLGTALTASARRNDYGAVLFIDMDRFKILNDTLGHEYGDLMLIEVGMRIKSCIRDMDTAARLGGDEFTVLLETLGSNLDKVKSHVAQVAEKIRAALTKPYQLKGHEHHSSPSIGVKVYHGNDESQNIVIEHADMAMYEAKKSGRNAVRFFDPVMQEDITTADMHRT